MSQPNRTRSPTDVPSRGATATPPLGLAAAAQPPASQDTIDAAIATYPAFGPTRDMDEYYEKTEKIGEGTYGEVRRS